MSVLVLGAWVVLEVGRGRGWPPFPLCWHSKWSEALGWLLSRS